MKILVTGCNGQVGWMLSQCDPDHVIPLTHQQCDITNSKQTNQVFDELQPTFVINCAAFTAVDRAETQIDEAYAINRDGTEIIAAACHRLNIPLLHLSTNYVFAGDKSTPYKEEDTTAPINIYAKSKWQGEERIRAILSRHIILRVSGVFGAYGDNFVKTILALATRQEKLNIVDDQIICPTPARDIAQTCLALSQQINRIDKDNLWGTYHYCSSEPISWYHFTKAIIEKAESTHPIKAKEILPARSESHPTAASRPKNSALDCTKIKTTFGIETPSWRQALKTIVLETAVKRPLQPGQSRQKLLSYCAQDDRKEWGNPMTSKMITDPD